MDNLNNRNLNWKPARNWGYYTLMTLLLLWTSHALGFFSHEYSHSFTAWLLGWKNSPLTLHYGHLTLDNLIAQFQIDENVDYSPIFASGHGRQAGVIALAGLFIGNLLLTYPLSRLGFVIAKRSNSRTFGLFFYWLCVASVGNLIDYVPVRTFAVDGDMFTLAKGFNCSPWSIIVILGFPIMIVLGHFFLGFAPRTLYWLFPESASRRVVTFILTAFAVFGFYGAAGWSETDAISPQISKFSVYILMPLAVLLGFYLANRLPAKTKIH